MGVTSLESLNPADLSDVVVTIELASAGDVVDAARRAHDRDLRTPTDPSRALIILRGRIST